MFGRKPAERQARSFRKRGLRGSAKALAGFAGEVRGESVLEVGGGIGAIEIELLEAGAARVTNIELAATYEDTARALLAERGLSERADRRVGDFVAEADAVEPHDVVVMHRVVCCYPDMPALVGAAATKAQRALAMTYPRDSWWTRLFASLVNVYMRLRGRAFRTFIHSPAGIRAAARAQGLRPTLESGGLLWQVVAFER